MDLHIQRGRGQRRVGAEGPGQRRRDGQVARIARRGPGREVGRRPGRLDVEQDVGAHVLDGLEAADGPAELDPLPGVADRHVERGLGRTDLLGGDQDADQVQDLVQRLRGRVGQRDGGRGVEGDVGQPAGQIEGRQGLDRHAGGVPVDREQRHHPVRDGAGGDNQEPCDMGVGDVALAAVQSPATARDLGGRAADAARVPATPGLGQGQRGDRRTGRDAG